MAAQELIYKIRFTGTDEQIDNISDLKNEITELSSANKALKKTGEENGKQYIKNEQQIKALRTEKAKQSRLNDQIIPRVSLTIATWQILLPYGSKVNY